MNINFTLSGPIVRFGNIAAVPLLPPKKLPTAKNLRRIPVPAEVFLISFLALDQGLAVHLGRLRQAHDLQHGGGDIRQTAALPQLGARHAH